MKPDHYHCRCRCEQCNKYRDIRDLNIAIAIINGNTFQSAAADFGLTTSSIPRSMKRTFMLVRHKYKKHPLLRTEHGTFRYDLKDYWQARREKEQYLPLVKSTLKTLWEAA